MSGKPAARLSDPTSCPVTGHGTNPIDIGSPNVLMDGLPAARQGDTSACGGALSGSLSGTVFINGMNAATLGSTLNHGGTVVAGSGSILIGDIVVIASFTAPAPLTIAANWINFTVPTSESYEGLSCTAHFDDGSSLSGMFDANNQVRFIPSGSVCQRLEFGIQDAVGTESVSSQLLNNILG